MTLLKRTLFCVVGGMQFMWFKVKKEIISHIPYIIVAPQCPAFLKRFYKAHRSEKRGVL